jgi:exopolyphosphatase/guanosine-5'-triphosphate,3'-diphosphate pyrophosphatase
MILAAIDVGTNSVKLLVARVERGRVRPLLQRVVITRLGEGLGKRSRISLAAADRTLETLAEFRRLAEDQGADRIAAAGTHALRAATDSKDFLVRCDYEAGLEVRVLTERQEAEIAFAGAIASSDSPRALVVDIGGGSMQLTLGTRRATEWHASVPLGAVVVTERHLRHDPPLRKELDTMNAEIARRLNPPWKQLRLRLGPRLPDLLGIGGTVATLAAVVFKHRRVDPVLVHGRTLGGARLGRLVGLLCSLTSAERRGMPGVEPGREDIIVAGGAALLEVMALLQVASLRVSAAGLRHGLVLEMAAGRA